MNDQYEVFSCTIRNESDVPRAKNIYYKCTDCGSIVPSDPKGKAITECSCGNIYIDMECFRLVVENYNKFQVLRKL